MRWQMFHVSTKEPSKCIFFVSRVDCVRRRCAQIGGLRTITSRFRHLIRSTWYENEIFLHKRPVLFHTIMPCARRSRCCTTHTYIFRQIFVWLYSATIYYRGSLLGARCSLVKMQTSYKTTEKKCSRWKYSTQSLSYLQTTATWTGWRWSINKSQLLKFTCRKLNKAHKIKELARNFRINECM